MNRTERKRIYRKALDLWGVNSQLGMLMEECAELIQSVNKVIREDEPERWLHLAEEMADVQIMIEQLQVIISWQCLEEKTAAAKEEKLARLRERVDR